MLLVVDVGNTNTVMGVYDGAALRAHWRVMTGNYRTVDEFRILLATLLHQEGLDHARITGCCVSSVVPQMNHAIEHACAQFLGHAPVFVGPGVKTGLVIQVENPKEVGADRIVNAVGALEAHGGPLIVIDFGTATTFDAIGANREYKGGVIAPGIQIAADALFEKCAKLPRIDLAIPATVIGRDTVAHMRAGLTYGYADLVDGLVRRMKAEMGGAPTVIATGGLAALVASIAGSIDHIDPLLTLTGLRVIYEKNAKP